MSDLKTLKAQHLAIEASLDAVAIKRAGPTAAAIADLVTLAERLESKLQQHEATIQQRERELEEADKALIEEVHYSIGPGLTRRQRQELKQHKPYQLAVARESARRAARAQQAEAKKEE